VTPVRIKVKSSELMSKQRGGRAAIYPWLAGAMGVFTLGICSQTWIVNGWNVGRHLTV